MSTNELWQRITRRQIERVRKIHEERLKAREATRNKQILLAQKRTKPGVRVTYVRNR
jgi:hypothetical protein